MSDLNRLPSRWCLVAVLAAALVCPLLLDPVPAAAQRSRDSDVPPEQREPRQPPRRERDKGPSKDGKAAEVPPKPIPSRIRPPGGSIVPQGGAERARLLAELYAHLATAADEEAGNRVASAIEHVWLTTGSDTVTLLVERARRAENDKQPELALRLLDRAIQLAPDYPELFNRRAALHFSQNNVRASLGDLRRVLALEPNHYKALEALGSIFKDIGRKKAALEVYRKLYEVHPQMPGAKSTLEELEREVNGQAS